MTIAESFSRASGSYHQKAEIQKRVAEGLIASLVPWKEIIPQGPILEVGCGTGFLTELLIREFPERQIIATDISGGMLEFIKERFDDHPGLSVQQLNAEDPGEEGPKYGLVISNFAAQWFSDTALGLEKLSGLLKPEGLLLCSFPGNHSFEEWYQCCLELGLPFTANPLPDVEEVVVKLSMGPLQIDYYENDLYQEFDRSVDFFRHLKELGAAVSITGKRLSSKQLRLLTDHWDNKAEGPVRIKWHVVYLAAKKDSL